MIAIVDYGSGNLQAIRNIYHRSSIPFVLAKRPEELEGADRILLPGVGAFDQAMGALNASGMRQALDRAVLEEGRPILGICVGMQLLATSSEEGGLPGLGWIDAAVLRFDAARITRPPRLPHMGWNTVEPTRESPLFAGVDLLNGYYFLHSYYVACREAADVLATTYYGVRFASAVHRGHVYGVQFHPEKSHQAGMQLLKNFATGAAF